MHFDHSFTPFLGGPDRLRTFLSLRWPLLDHFYGPGKVRGPRGVPAGTPGGRSGGRKMAKKFTNFFLLQITFLGSPEGLEASKPQNWPPAAPN